MDRKQLHVTHQSHKQTRQPDSPTVSNVDPALLQRAIEDPELLTAETAEALQQTHGNQFVSGLVQQRSDASQAIQRQEEEEELLMLKRDETALQRQEEEEELMMKRDETALQRQEELEEEEMIQAKAVQRQSHEDGFDLDGDTANRINSARSGGTSLNQNVQAKFGQAMNFDFSGVKIHNDSESDSLNTAVQARAFTTGQDIFFKQGEYNPGTTGGNELLAHELTHVVQQSTGQVPSSGSGMSVRPAGDAFEQEADSVAKQVAHQDYETGED